MALGGVGAVILAGWHLYYEADIIGAVIGFLCVLLPAFAYAVIISDPQEGRKSSSLDLVSKASVDHERQLQKAVQRAQADADKERLDLQRKYDSTILKMEDELRQALSKSEALAEKLEEGAGAFKAGFLERMPGPVLVGLRGRGDIIYTNEAARTYLGLENLEDLTLKDIFVDQDDWEEYRLSLNNTDGIHDQQVQVRSGDGGLDQWALLAAQNVDFEGKAAVLMSFADIAELKQHEAMLADAKEDAEEAALARGQFIASAAHEIRTPMNGVLGIAKLLADTDLNSDQANYVRAINSSSEALLTLLDGLLDMAKHETGELAVASMPFNMQSIVDEAANLMRAQAIDKGLELIVDLDPDMPTVFRSDPKRIRQILLNLLGNAVKYTDSGSVELRVEQLESEDSSKAELVFTVEDTGIGIPIEAQDALFEAYTQVGGAERTSRYGTGLGLSVCKTLVELLGGQIGLESEEGEGSSFWFTLTLEIGREEEVAAPELVSQSPAIETEGLDLLLVEDEPVNRMVALGFLQKQGHRITVAVNGLEAVQQAGTKRFDAIIMDVHMPKLDGLAATRQIRELDDPQRAGIPIIAMTANVVAGEKERCFEAGMNAFISKPVDPDKLNAALSKVELGEDILDEDDKVVEEAVEIAEPLEDNGLVDWTLMEVISETLGAEKLQSLLLEFDNTCAETLTGVREAWAAEDITGVGRQAHRMFSGASHLGMLALADHVASIERAADASDVETLKPLVAGLPDMVGQSIAEVVEKGYRPAPGGD